MDVHITTDDPQRHPLARHASHSAGETIMDCDDPHCAAYAALMRAIDDASTIIKREARA